MLAKLSGKTALIIFTDGDSNYGNDPVAEAQALYDKYPNLCIHIVSYADNAHGKKVVVPDPRPEPLQRGGRPQGHGRVMPA